MRTRHQSSLFVLTLLAIACRESPAPDPPPAPPQTTQEAPDPRRGLWVLAEGHVRVLDAPERVPVLVEQARGLGATDLLVQVHRGGRAWYDASLADATPHRSVLEATGVDTLAALLRDAHAAGMRVHAWVNVLSLAKNREAPILRALGASAVLVDRRGRSLLDYPAGDVPEPDRRHVRMGTPGLYLDPGAPGLRAYLVASFRELLERYPDLDGLHLDYIRYPDVLPFAPGTRFGVGLDFGYGSATRERFRVETGREAPFQDSLRNANRWDEWRRDQVTALVREIATSARDVVPGVEISAAVWTYANRAYLSMGQDWRGWLDEGFLDFAIPMAYSRDDRLLRYLLEHFAGLPHAPRIWPGLGVWLFSNEPARALAQLRSVRESGLPHVALFSYDSIVAAEPLHRALAESKP